MTDDGAISGAPCWHPTVSKYVQRAAPWAIAHVVLISCRKKPDTPYLAHPRVQPISTDIANETGTSNRHNKLSETRRANHHLSLNMNDDEKQSRQKTFPVKMILSSSV